MTIYRDWQGNWHDTEKTREEHDEMLETLLLDLGYRPVNTELWEGKDRLIAVIKGGPRKW